MEQGRQPPVLRLDRQQHPCLQPRGPHRVPVNSPYSSAPVVTSVSETILNKNRVAGNLLTWRLDSAIKAKKPAFLWPRSRATCSTKWALMHSSTTTSCCHSFWTDLRMVLSIHCFCDHATFSVKLSKQWTEWSWQSQSK